MKPRLELPVALLLGACVRLPFLLEALRTPVDGDEAIVGLMARHVGQGLTFWGTAYMSPLEAWLAAPLVWLLGPTQAPIRIFYFLASLALVPLAHALAGVLSARAAFPAALLMAVPSPYFLLMAGLPPEVYPTILLLCGALLLITLHSDGGLAGWWSVAAALWGALAGLALWTHPMTATIVAVCALFLLIHTRGGWRWLAVALIPLLLLSAPWWSRAIGDRRALAVASVSSQQDSFASHAATVALALHRPLGGVIGTHAPMNADDSDHIVDTPLPVAALLALAHGLALLAALARSRGRAGVLLLLGAVVLPVLVFPLPLRSNPDAIRYLTPIYLPLLALFACTAEDVLGRARALGLVLGIAALNLVGGQRLLAAWQANDRSQPPFELPDLEPVRQFLERHGITRAYASYGPAYRLTYESGERLIVSQPWNERFPDEPLPYLDEVRFGKNVAWILTPSVSTRLASSERFEAELKLAGGSYQRDSVGAAIIYHTFAPPFGSRVVPLATAGLAGDGDLTTRIAEPAQGASTYHLSVPTPLDAITLVAAHGDLRLPRSMDVEISADGNRFEIVTQRGRGRGYRDLRWVNGHPQYVIDDDLIAIPLSGRTVSALRVVPIRSSQAWAMGEILLHVTAAEARSGTWSEWLSPMPESWAARRTALEATPHRDREDWYYRTLLSARHD